MIKVENLKKNFKSVQVLKGITTQINKGDVLCVIGPSGSGKSTFLRCLNMLETPTEGSIVFDGIELTDKNTNLDLHRQKMGMVFQQFNLFPHMTVLDNLTCAPVMLKKMTKEQAEAKKNKTAGKDGETNIKKEEGAAAKKNEAAAKPVETSVEQEEGDAA